MPLAGALYVYDLERNHLVILRHDVLTDEPGMGLGRRLVDLEFARDRVGEHQALSVSNFLLARDGHVGGELNKRRRRVWNCSNNVGCGANVGADDSFH